jgi:hypothetical protein
MSAIASFYLVDSSRLGELQQNAEIIVRKTLFSKKVTDNFPVFLSANATELKGLDGGGYVYGNLFVFLDEQKDIDLLSSGLEEVANNLADMRGTACFIFTYKQKMEFLNRLVPDEYSLSELQNFNREFSEEGDEETAMLMKEALQILKHNLAQIPGNEKVLLLIVG